MSYAPEKPATSRAGVDAAARQAREAAALRENLRRRKEQARARAPQDAPAPDSPANDGPACDAPATDLPPPGGPAGA